MKRLWAACGLAVCGLFMSLPQRTEADLPGFGVSLWDIHTGGIWRKEVRTRELARWYRHYEWRSVQRLWLKRRAEGVWLRGQSLTQFTCVAHCVLRGPDGNIWRIWRQFQVTDLRRWRAHYRIWWVGHGVPQIAAAFPNPNNPAPQNARFCQTLDHLEVVIPMEPADPNPETSFHEGVLVQIGNGPMVPWNGQTLLPDTAMNPGGYQLATTANAEGLLPLPAERLIDPPFQPQPGHVEISPGVVVEWLMDDQGNVLVDNDGDPGPDPVELVLGGQKHQGLLDQPTGITGVELDINTGNTPPQLYCWLLDPNGNIVGEAAGQTIIGPPIDLNGDGQADNAFGAPIPMDPTVRDEHNTLDPTARPFEMAVVEEDEPTVAELAVLNARLQQAGIAPVFPPFKLCIEQWRLRRAWGIDRRVVMDTWFHHWIWRVSHHINLTVGLHRVWLTRVALSAFQSSHHHYVVGQPPTWNTITITGLRFFRVCYRIYCPRPNQLRVKIDELWMVVPEDASNPNSPLMLVTTESNENRLLPPPVMAGLQPDPLPVGPDGVFVQTLDPVNDAMDMGVGGTGIFDGDLTPLIGGNMQDIAVVGNEDLAQALANNQLQLYCWPLNANGTLRQENYPGGPNSDPVVFTSGPAPAMPAFEDDMGNVMTNPTMLGFNAMATDVSTPRATWVLQNHPDPFNPLTTITYSVPSGGRARLAVFDVRGRELKVLVDGPVVAGTGTVTWDGRDAAGAALPSGVYIARLESPDGVRSEKLTLTK